MSSLSDLADRLEGMQSNAFHTAIAWSVGREVLRQIDYGFETRSDPYGAYWKERKGSYPWPTLEKTRELRNSFLVTDVRPGSVRIESHCEYGGFHQGGTKHIDIRRMVPVESRGLGVWGPRLKYLVADAVIGAIRG